MMAQQMNKYNAKRTFFDGIWFDSKKEAHRYQQLKLMLRAGKISDLELQPRYDIVVNGEKICYYKADFRYIENGELVVEDVKGMQTSVYKLKKKLVKACHGIEIREV